MQEEWKDIEGYEGIYLISNLGRCRNIKNGNLMKVNNSFKYPRYALSNNGKTEKLYIHRLVAKAFIPNPMNFDTVNHIDENHFHNSPDNLEWCSNIENSIKYYRKDDFTERKIGQYDVAGTEINIFNSIKSAGRFINKGHSAISQCCNEKRKSAYGYVWRYTM
jgi:hypothetical protein